MAGSLLNLSIFTKSTFHALRAISLAVFPPAFIILLVQGIISGDVNPAIGILPLFFSSAFSALLLANEKKCGCQASGLMGTPLHLVCDVCLGVGLLVCLILDWVCMSNSEWVPHGIVMLGTYGTNFLICNFLIHCYIVAKQVSDGLTPGSNYPMSCPQCQHVSFSFGHFQIGRGFHSDYTPLLDNDGQPSTSTEGAKVNQTQSESMV